MSEQRSPLMSAVRPNSDAEHKLESLRPNRSLAHRGVKSVKGMFLMFPCPLVYRGGGGWGPDFIDLRGRTWNFIDLSSITLDTA